MGLGGCQIFNYLPFPPTTLLNGTALTKELLFGCLFSARGAGSPGSGGVRAACRGGEAGGAGAGEEEGRVTPTGGEEGQRSAAGPGGRAEGQGVRGTSYQHHYCHHHYSLYHHHHCCLHQHISPLTRV